MPSTDADSDRDRRAPRLAGRWIVAIVLIWPALVYLAFVLLTR